MRIRFAVPLLLIAACADLGAQEADTAQSALGYLCRGDERMESGDPDGAIDDVTQAIRLRPGRSAGFQGRGRAKYRKGDLEGAISDLSVAIRLDPEDARARRVRGDAHGDNRDFNAAIADYDEALRLNPADRLAWLNRGQTRLESGEFKAAIADTDEAIRLESESYRAWTNRGHLAVFAMLCRLRLQERELFTPEIKAVFEGRDPRAKDDWPPAVAAFLRGDLTEEELLKMRASATGTKALERECEAWFYVAAVSWTQGKTGKAIQACEKCLATKMYAFYDYVRARAALARLRNKK
ncbi:MAG: tetratricopeptide repeat protein [Planctomycetes bacterium]|nr:tetratricopeptide repeat protein [Planctomycetota bacterium]